MAKEGDRIKHQVLIRKQYIKKDRKMDTLLIPEGKLRRD